MFNPNFYNPYMVGAPQTPYNAPNAPAQPQNTQPNVFTYVNGLEGAKAYIVPPNGKVLLMDSDNPIFYLKAANEYGQANIRAFKFEEMNAAPTPTAQSTAYATAETVDALSARIQKIEEAINGRTNVGASKKANSGIE